MCKLNICNDRASYSESIYRGNTCDYTYLKKKAFVGKKGSTYENLDTSSQHWFKTLLSYDRIRI